MLPLSGTVTINGVTYRYSLEAADGQTQAPMPAAPPPRPGEEIHTVVILTHQVKSGIATKGPRVGQPYEMHTFRGSDNRNYVTFKPELAARLSPLVGRNDPVRIVGVRDGRGGVRINDVT